MNTLFSYITFLFLLLAFSTHIFSLPANWFMLAILIIWAWIAPNADVSSTTFLVFTAAAFLGECIEFALQSIGARKYGATSSGNWGSIAGAVLGALVGAPFFFGLGALAGAIGGAYLGCLSIELWNNRLFQEAQRAALGAMFGKVLGLSVKIGIGIILLFQSARILF